MIRGLLGDQAASGIQVTIDTQAGQPTTTNTLGVLDFWAVESTSTSVAFMCLGPAIITSSQLQLSFRFESIVEQLSQLLGHRPQTIGDNRFTLCYPTAKLRRTTSPS